MEDQDVWQQFAEMCRKTDPRIWIGLVVMIGMYILEAKLVSKGHFRSKREKQKEAARAAGRMFLAHRVKCTRTVRDGPKNGREYTYTARYEYEVNGRTHKTAVVVRNAEPPSAITMYYDKDPEKAFSDYQTGGGWITGLATILPLATAVAVMLLLGYKGE